MRVKSGKVVLKNDPEETLDYYAHRLAVEQDLESSLLQVDVRLWHEKIELIYGENVLCHQFINVKAINRAS